MGVQSSGPNSAAALQTSVSEEREKRKSSISKTSNQSWTLCLWPDVSLQPGSPQQLADKTVQGFWTQLLKWTFCFNRLSFCRFYWFHYHYSLCGAWRTAVAANNRSSLLYFFFTYTTPLWIVHNNCSSKLFSSIHSRHTSLDWRTSNCLNSSKYAALLSHLLIIHCGQRASLGCLVALRRISKTQVSIKGLESWKDALTNKQTKKKEKKRVQCAKQDVYFKNRLSGIKARRNSKGER